jgi:hypothetical protein
VSERLERTTLGKVIVQDLLRGMYFVIAPERLYSFFIQGLWSEKHPKSRLLAETPCLYDLQEGKVSQFSFLLSFFSLATLHSLIAKWKIATVFPDLDALVLSLIPSTFGTI